MIGDVRVTQVRKAETNDSIDTVELDVVLVSQEPFPKLLLDNPDDPITEIDKIH